MRRALISLVCLLAMLVLGSCGSSDPKSNAPSAAAIKAAFAGSPPVLEKLHRQANQLVGGKKSDFEARLAGLHGHPVVVNKWAAWCAPCRGEFPVFQQAAVKLGKRVAFLGVDAQDNYGDAAKFLKRYPVTYPSYKDPDLKISASIQAGVASPTTIFFDSRGKLVYAHPGPYGNARELIADVKRYTG